MRVKLDENLPTSLVQELKSLGHDVDTVPDEGLAGALDPAVWTATQGEARFFVTQDLDFSDTRSFAPGTHHGVLLLRFGNPSRSDLVALVTAIFRSEPVSSWVGCFVVATRSRIRVRRPPAE